MTLVEMLKIDEKIDFDFNSIISYMFRNLEVIGDEIILKSDNKNRVNLDKFIESVTHLSYIIHELDHIRSHEFSYEYGIVECNNAVTHGGDLPYGRVILFHINKDHLDLIAMRDSYHDEKFYIYELIVNDDVIVTSDSMIFRDNDYMNKNLNGSFQSKLVFMPKYISPLD